MACMKLTLAIVHGGWQDQRHYLKLTAPIPSGGHEALRLIEDGEVTAVSIGS